jgi:hypothetical protein
MQQLRARSTLAFALLALTLVGIKLLFDFYPGDFPLKSQAEAFTWLLVGGMIAFAAVGLLCDRAAGLPDPFADMARERQGLVVAAITGAVYGLVTIASDVASSTRTAIGDEGEWVHMALPWSIPFYTFGAIFLEFLLRLGGLCVAFWLLHVVVFRRRLRLPLFWLVAAVVALYEIWPFMADDVSAGHWGSVVRALAGHLYLSNVFEGWLVLRYGWFSPVVFRLSFYLVWHILYGGLAGP